MPHTVATPYSEYYIEAQAHPGHTKVMQRITQHTLDGTQLNSPIHTFIHCLF